MKQIHPYIIGIAGPSCAGKTCIATQIANSLPSGFTSLISIDENNYVITKVPVPSPEMSSSKITSNISLVDGVVKASEKRLMTG